MRRSVDAPCEPAGDGEARIGKLERDLLRALGGVVGRFARADDTDGMALP